MTEHESCPCCVIWGTGDRGLNKLDVPLQRATVGTSSIAVAGIERMRATESLGTEALAFKWGLCLQPKY